MRKSGLAMVLALALAVGAFAADITGAWKGETKTRNGDTREVTFNLKASGDKLTGTVDMGMGGPAEISNGKVEGETVSFDVKREFNGNSFTMHYTGKVSGDQINLKSEMEGRPPREMTIKRVS